MGWVRVRAGLRVRGRRLGLGVDLIFDQVIVQYNVFQVAQYCITKFSRWLIIARYKVGMGLGVKLGLGIGLVVKAGYGCRGRVGSRGKVGFRGRVGVWLRGRVRDDLNN